MSAAASFWRRFLAMMRAAIARSGEEARASWRLLGFCITAAPSTPAHPAFAEDLRSAAKIVNQRSVGTNARNSNSWPRLNASCKSR